MAGGCREAYACASMATVGDRIQQRRVQLGLAQRELADQGVSAQYISKVEQGRRHPSVKALRKLAPKLGVSVHWLETGQEDPAEELALLVLDREPSTSPLTDLALAVLQEREREWPTRPRNKSLGVRWTAA
jgi:transcriptional regulator with XRE-family HTH domain